MHSNELEEYIALNQPPSDFKEFIKIYTEIKTILGIDKARKFAASIPGFVLFF